MKLSRLADQIQTSPILTFAAAINARKAAGESLYNLTVGDFDPRIFPVPDALTEATIQAYRDRQTNYPGAFGLPGTREGVAHLLNRTCYLDYGPEDVIVASGSRPMIYAAYRTIVDPGDKVVFPVPSWNNEHYAAMNEAHIQTVETDPSNRFMPTAEMLEPHLEDAVLLALCSPLNPTGTVLSHGDLLDICNLVVDINSRRSEHLKPLYVLFDQVYWMLTFSGTRFTHPLVACPEIGDYAVFVDGLSKAFAGTGIRVGWSTGAPHVLEKMVSVIAHAGAWAPRPDQAAVGEFLRMDAAVDEYLETFRTALETRLEGFHQGIMTLRDKGYPVDAIAPEAAIYLSVKIDIQGRTTADGRVLDTGDDVQEYLVDAARLGVLPFSWFGARSHGNWFRISVGTCDTADIEPAINGLESALAGLKPI
jgi:aspartate aminotransferase